MALIFSLSGIGFCISILVIHIKTVAYSEIRLWNCFAFLVFLAFLLALGVLLFPMCCIKMLASNEETPFSFVEHQESKWLNFSKGFRRRATRISVLISPVTTGFCLPFWIYSKWGTTDQSWFYTFPISKGLFRVFFSILITCSVSTLLGPAIVHVILYYRRSTANLWFVPFGLKRIVASDCFTMGPFDAKNIKSIELHKRNCTLAHDPCE